MNQKSSKTGLLQLERLQRKILLVLLSPLTSTRINSLRRVYINIEKKKSLIMQKDLYALHCIYSGRENNSLMFRGSSRCGVGLMLVPKTIGPISP